MNDLETLGDEATRLRGNCRWGFEEDCRIDERITEFERQLAQTSDEIVDVTKRTEEILRPRSEYLDQLGIIQRKHELITDIQSRAGDLALRIGNAKSQKGYFERAMEASMLHYQAYEGEYYELAVIEAHLEGVELNLEDPVVLGRK